MLDGNLGILGSCRTYNSKPSSGLKNGENSMTSPLEKLIDNATGYKAAPMPKKRNPATDAQKKIAYAAGDELIWHIDQMYPSMWEGVPKSARTSIKNTVYNRVISILTDPEISSST